MARTIPLREYLRMAGIVPAGEILSHKLQVIPATEYTKHLKGEAGVNGRDGYNGKDGVDGRDGSEGPMGPMGPQGLDGTGFNWRGNWLENLTYQPNDVVNYLGSSYIAVGASTGDYPNRIKNNWDLVASAGAQGPSGRDAEDFNVVSVDSDYTVISGLGLVLVDASVADVTVTLPSAGDRTGRIITVKKTDSSSNSVVLSSPNSVDGQDTVCITTQNVSISAQSDGYNWWII